MLADDEDYAPSIHDDMDNIDNFESFVANNQLKRKATSGKVIGTTGRDKTKQTQWTEEKELVLLSLWKAKSAHLKKARERLTLGDRKCAVVAELKSYSSFKNDFSDLSVDGLSKKIDRTSKTLCE
jgi:hypothetical protein